MGKNESGQVKIKSMRRAKRKVNEVLIEHLQNRRWGMNIELGIKL